MDTSAEDAASHFGGHRMSSNPMMTGGMVNHESLKKQKEAEAMTVLLSEKLTAQTELMRAQKKKNMKLENKGKGKVSRGRKGRGKVKKAMGSKKQDIEIELSDMEGGKETKPEPVQVFQIAAIPESNTKSKWTETLAPNGKKYWFNSETKESTWVNPHIKTGPSPAGMPTRAEKIRRLSQKNPKGLLRKSSATRKADFISPESKKYRVSLDPTSGKK